jgi:hypothetical protein
MEAASSSALEFAMCEVLATRASIGLTVYPPAVAIFARAAHCQRRADAGGELTANQGGLTVQATMRRKQQSGPVTGLI